MRSTPEAQINHHLDPRLHLEKEDFSGFLRKILPQDKIDPESSRIRPTLGDIDFSGYPEP